MGLLARLGARLLALLAPPPEPPAPPAPALPTPPQGARSKLAKRQLAEAKARAAAADERARLATQRLKDAEARAKGAAEDNRRAKRGATGGAAQAKEADVRIRAAEERARAAERRAEEGAQRAHDATERARRLEVKCRELEARAEEANGHAKAAEARAAAAIERAAVTAPPATSVAAAPAAADGAPATTAEVSFSPGEACLQTIRAQVSRARRSIDVCVFTITDDRIAAAILDAHRRGVEVRVITDNDKSLDEGSDVDRLARAGVPVRKDMTECHMHHKFAVFDGRLMLTGSYNWTRSAARYNEENLIVSGDPRLVGPFAREFEALWSKLAPR